MKSLRRRWPAAEHSLRLLLLLLLLPRSAPAAVVTQTRPRSAADERSWMAASAIQRMT